ncbi:MAG: glycosyltransferase [Verrucomicrobiota bacterium]
MKFDEQLWLAKSKLQFLLTPKQRRVRLEIATDGRQLTYLLVSLQALGYALQVVDSPMLFRELVCLRLSKSPPFIYGGAPRECAFVISDQPQVIAQAVREGIPGLFLDADYFSPGRKEMRMPYFMHPMIYHRGWHRLAVPPAENARPIRLGFFGTRDPDFYTRDFHFPMLNREQILAAFLSGFEDLIWEVDGPVGEWLPKPVAVAMDVKGGDRAGKSFLTLADYLQALRRCDFFLTPPGKVMPFSHNLIEGMAAGCIPVLNYPEYLDPPLEPGVNCLAFRDVAGLNKTVESLLKMDPSEIFKMRAAVLQYYRQHLEPGQWLGNLLRKAGQNQNLLVNAEEVSLSLVNH